MNLIKKFFIISIIIILSLTFLSACKFKKIDELEKEVEDLEEKLEGRESAEKESSNITREETGSQNGQIIKEDEVEICIPPQDGEIQPEITVEKVTDDIPAPPEDSKRVVEAYEINSDIDTQGPKLLTFSYDPATLPEGTNEEKLYIATIIDGSWEAIEGGLIDTDKNTISVSVEHFSFFGILESAQDAVYGVVGAIQDYTEDISRQSFSDLPGGIKDDLADIVTQDVKAVVKLELSHLTKFSSAIVDFAGLVSETSELALDVVDGTKQAIVKGATLTAASLASQYADSELGSFSLMLYSSAETGKDIGKYLGGADLDPYTIAAETAAWVLAMEMQYINDNMDKAFTGIYKYNIFSLSRLKMYAVFIDSRPIPDAGKPRMKGIKFYYYDEGKDEWVNYYNDTVTWEIEAEFKGETTEEKQEADTEETGQSEEKESKKEYVILFTSQRYGKEDIFTINADGTDIKNLTDNPGSGDWWPRVSPDGKKIVFTSRRDGQNDIFMMNADGTGVINLTNNPGSDDGRPCFSPDGKKIVFESERDGSEDIFIMNSDGTGVTNLTESSSLDDRRPSFSPDGDKILFESEPGKDDDIFIMNSDGTGVDNLTSDCDGEDESPLFSPDGNKIIFVSKRDGNWEIYIMDVDGSAVTNLTRSAAADLFYCFSPDGEKIVFESDRDGNDDVFIMNSDGTGLTNLTDDSEAYDGYPKFSPDGKKIAFLSGRDGDDDIFIMNTDGTDVANLTNNPDSFDWVASFMP